MDPRELAAALQSYSPQQLQALDHQSLYAARQYLPSREQQNRVAPYEHRAFAREAVAENPMMALPVAAGALLYQPYKALLGKSRSDPSLAQVGQGLAGVGEGLWSAFRNSMQATQAQAATPPQGLVASLKGYLGG